MSGSERQAAKDLPRGKLQLSDVLRLAQRKASLELSVAYPCEILEFDATTQLATVMCDFSHVHRDDSGEQVLPAEVLPNIMVAFEGATPTTFSDGGYLSFPVYPGAKGYVTVFDRSVERWSSGGAGDPSLPGAHQRISGVCRMGLRDETRAIPNFDQAAAVLEHTAIKLGANATEAAALGSTLYNWAVDLTNWIVGHVHTGVQPGTGATGTSGFPPTVPVFLSSKVKIE